MIREKKITIPEIKKMKERGEKIILAPVWDYNSTRIAEEAGAHIVSVGDGTVAMMLGNDPHTLNVEMEEVLFLVRKMKPAVERTVSFSTMPFGSFQVSNEQAVRNAIKIIKAGAHSVLIQASGPLLTRVEAVAGTGIEVLGHVGLRPQYYYKLGGYRVFGNTCSEAIELYKEVKRLEDIGVYAIEMECVPAKIAREISKRVKIPILGIGSGPGTDGQILVLVDLWGLQKTIKPKFMKRYVDLWPVCVDSFKKAIDEVNNNLFPAKEHSYDVEDNEFEDFMDFLNK